MMLKYFSYFLPPAIILLSLTPIFWWFWYARLKYLQKISRINILKRQQKSEKATFYSSLIIERSVLWLYLHPLKNKKILRQMAGGRSESAAYALRYSHPFAALLLLAHSNAAQAYRKIHKQRAYWFKSSFYAPFVPLLAHLLFKVDDFLQFIRRLNTTEISRLSRPYYHFLAAYAYLQEADILSASEQASLAQKQFHKLKYAHETAQCYILLGEIYRISCLNDISQTMNEAALKIYKEQKLPLNQAQTLAVLAMLMVFSGRYEEAEDKYIQALKLAPTQQMKAYILNQYALLDIVNNNLKSAEQKAIQALNIHKTLKNSVGTAYSHQLKGQIAYNDRHYRTAQKESALAAQSYEKLHNYSALSESLYLVAQSLLKQQKYKTAEKHLRQILEINRAHPNNFHIAGAYSLLGLIYMKTDDLPRAKVLFQQSLHLEQQHNRCEGLVADYSNLACIEELSGHRDEALDNLKISLEYAQKSEDNELIQLITDKINKIT